VIEITLLQLIERAMDQTGADGLWNGNGPCGCGRGDLNPGDCMSVDCVLAKSKVATEDEVDDCIDVGDTVWFPIQFRTADVLASNSVLDGSARPQQCGGGGNGDKP
jgi:hypothetical protein